MADPPIHTLTFDDDDESEGQQTFSEWTVFSASDWGHSTGKRGGSRWTNKKTGEVVYSKENPGGKEAKKALGVSQAIAPAKAHFASAGAKQALRNWLGREPAEHDLTALTGATPDSIITVENDRKEGLSLDVQGNGYDAKRILKKDKAGKLYIHNEFFYIREQHQGQGLGTRMFADQVKHAAAMGIDRIETEAAGKAATPGQAAHLKPLNGYITWAKLGYDGPLTGEHKRALPEPYKNASTVQEVMAMPGGDKAWAKYGSTFKGVFDVKEGSRSRQILDAYVARKAEEKATKEAPATKQAEEPEREGDEIASAQDHAILDEVWKDIQEKGFQSSPAEHAEDSPDQITEMDVRQQILAQVVDVTTRGREQVGDGAPLPPEVQEEVARLQGLLAPDKVKEMVAELNAGQS